MGPVRPPLHIDRVWRAQRPVRAQLEGRPVDEGSVGKDNLVAVAGGDSGDRDDVSADGGAALHGGAEGEHLGAAAQLDGLYDVGAAANPRRRIALVPEAAHRLGDQEGALESLAHDLGRVEEPLKERARHAERRAALHARSRQPTTRGRDEVGAARHVAARGGERAARVLDERSGDEVRADVARLLNLDELAVAVVHKQDERRVMRPQPAR
mmetsp:Transcript_46457/g.149757  ORF Transcript_46457/g.149757 Transcript_46457/m.149757 type:complete len:211 (-) Transcript_46457:668-1300(-)